MKLIFTLLVAGTLLSFSEKTRTITGTVTDAKSGEALIGVNISYKGRAYVTVSDLDGKFEISTENSSDSILDFSYIGYESQEINITGKVSIKVALVPQTGKIDEVVVTGLKVTRKQKEMSFATTTVPGVSSTTTFYAPFDGFISDGSVGASDRVVKEGESSFRSDTISESGDLDIISPGMLTAGEVNDFSKWKLWNDKSQEELRDHKKIWNISPSVRFALLVQNQDGFPVVEQTVFLLDNNKDTVWTARTDNTGKAELWINMFDEKYTDQSGFSITANVNGKKYEIKQAKRFNAGVNQLTVNKTCAVSKQVQAAFVVDATGSMGDEINYLKMELSNVMQEVRNKNPKLSVELGSVFYRDKGDQYLTKKTDLSTDIFKTISFIKDQTAYGGDDFPEAVDDALDVAVNDLSWSDSAIAKIIFLILDAPPHDNPAVLQRLKKIIAQTAAKGIKIVPVTASGIDKSTEYLMRSLALCTNGTYVFLTDDSGIGDPHIKPTTDEYTVEKLNDLLLRLFNQFTSVVSCGKETAAVKDSTISDTAKISGIITDLVDTTATTTDTSTAKIGVKDSVPILTYSCLFYPNPTSGILYVDIKGNIKEIFLNDISGKILERFEVNGRESFQVDLSPYPRGVYFMAYFGSNEKPASGRIVLIK